MLFQLNSRTRTIETFHIKVTANVNDFLPMALGIISVDITVLVIYGMNYHK